MDVPLENIVVKINGVECEPFGHDDGIIPSLPEVTPNSLLADASLWVTAARCWADKASASSTSTDKGVNLSEMCKCATKVMEHEEALNFMMPHSSDIDAIAYVAMRKLSLETMQVVGGAILACYRSPNEKEGDC